MSTANASIFEMRRRASGFANEIDDAVRLLLEEFSWNEWFTNTFWPENKERVRLMLADVIAGIPPASETRLLDIGCANGFASFLFSKLGYRVTATDTENVPERPALFNRCGVDFFPSNLNDTDPFPHLTDGCFDVVLMGELIEHILNHPLGLMRSVGRVLRPGGVIILTTPNPATIINAYRMIKGTFTLWGARSFMDLAKIKDAKIIDAGDVHYREYLTSEIRYLLVSSGFEIKRVNYFEHGISRQQPFWKRMLKGNLVVRKLMARRLFGANQYFLASKRQ